MKYMPIPVLTRLVYIYKSSHESVFYNNIICKNFDTGIYRPTSLHVPRVGLHEEVGVSRKRQNDVMKDKIDL